MSTSLARFAPGLLAAAGVALAARFIAAPLDAPAAVVALLLGLGLAALNAPALRLGLEFAAKPVLRLAIGLLGAQVALAHLAALGFGAFFATTAVTLITFVAGLWIGRRFGLSNINATIVAASVAICGASAALAVAAVLPEERCKDQATLAIVAGVNILSTIAMALYPPIGAALGLDDVWIGAFLGMSIHDVAQVAAAGIGVSAEAAASAATVKLTRVLLLAPLVIAIGLFLRLRRVHTAQAAKPPPLAPWFLLLFIALVAVRSLGLIPETIVQTAGEVSSFLLVAAVGAIGALVAPRELLRTSPRLIAQLVVVTVLIAALSALAVTQLQPRG